MSNRRAWILKVNHLLNSNKLFISENCKNLIKEFQTHYYKDGKKDGEVDKINDDLLDALRYLIFNLKTRRFVSIKEKNYKKKFGNPYTMDIPKNTRSPFFNF